MCFYIGIVLVGIVTAIPFGTDTRLIRPFVVVVVLHAEWRKSMNFAMEAFLTFK